MQDQKCDKTFLSIDNAEERGFIHRDYIAHCLRWSHVIKFLGQKNRYKTARILDIGCGKETPLAKTLYTSKMSPTGGYYVGVDYGKIPHQEIHDKMEAKFDFDVIENVDSSIHITENAISDSSEEMAVFDDETKPNIITSFEVLEHMPPAKVVKTLENIWNIADPNADIFISTPNFNGKAAANHINEMTYSFLLNLFMAMGFDIESVYGTFASQADYKPQLIEDGYKKLFEELSEYYDSNLLSIIFAPKYPGFSRNALWHLKPSTSIDKDLIQKLIEEAGSETYSSSNDSWAEALEQVL